MAWGLRAARLQAEDMLRTAAETRGSSVEAMSEPFVWDDWVIVDALLVNGDRLRGMAHMPREIRAALD